MTAIRALANSVFRDYTIDGVPSSNAGNPDKASIRMLFASLDTILSDTLDDLSSKGATLQTLQGTVDTHTGKFVTDEATLSTHSSQIATLQTVSGSSGLAYLTRAALYADLAHAANSAAWVVADSTAAYNGLYVKVGASGSGSWSYGMALPAGAADISSALATLTASLTATAGGPFITNDIANLYSPSISDAQQNKLYLTGDGSVVTLNAAATSGKIPVVPGKTYTIDLSGCDLEWTLYDSANMHRFGSGGAWLRFGATGLTVAADLRSAVYVAQSDEYFVAFNLKYLVNNVFDTTNNFIPTGAFTRLRSQIMVATPTGGLAPVHSTYTATPPSNRPNPAVDPLVKSAAIAVAIHGACVYVRTGWNSSYDQVRRIYHAITPNETNSGGIDFRGTRLVTAGQDANYLPGLFAAGTSLHDDNDDMPPAQINGMYLSGNHGPTARMVTTSASHGKTTADLGSTWVDGSSRNWVLMRILGATKIIVAPVNTGTSTAWTFYGGAPTGTMSHVSGATNTANMTVSSDAQTQLHPAKANLTVQLFLDSVPISADGVYYGRELTFVEQHTVKNPAAVLTYFTGHVGAVVAPDDYLNSGIADQAEVTNSYRINAEGALSYAYSYRALQAHTLSILGGAQAQAITYATSLKAVAIGMGTSQNNVLGSSPLNFSVNGGGATISGISQQYDFAAANWKSANYPPAHFAQLAISGSTPTIGFAMGYSETLGVTTPATRKTNLSTKAGFISSAPKLYSWAAENLSLSGGELFEVCGYIGFFDPTADTNSLVKLTWKDGGYDVVTWATSQTLTKQWIPLPKRLVGKSISRIDSDSDSAAVTIHSTIVSARGVLVSTSGPGAARLKFT